jgi:hypothetical protein
MLRIAGAVNGRIAKDRDREVGAGCHSVLDPDLVVRLVDDHRPQRRGLRQGHGLQRTRLGPMRTPEGAVDVYARNDHRAARDPAEVEEAPRIVGDVRNHVDHDLGAEGPELVDVLVPAGEVTVDVPHCGRQLGLVLAAVDDRDLVPALSELADRVRARERRPAEEEDAQMLQATYSSAIASASSRIATPSSSSSRVIVSGGTTMITFQCVIR